MADCQSTVNDTIDKPKIKHTTFVCGATLHDSKKTTLQEAFLRYRKARQDEIRNSKQMKERELSCRKDLSQMEALRQRFIEQVKKYMGVPYSRKYWPPDSDEYNSSLFLDCCGLVRQVLRDLADDFGFQIGSWNQAYMYDTLPITIEREEDMKPGDLVFISATYYNTKSKKQRHDMTHVEIWAGEGPKTIGARWNNGKVQIWDHYKFVARSFHSETYHFKSIDTWLMGICKSFCKEHSWRRSPYDPVKKSIFALPEDTSEDEEAGDEDNICDDNVIIQSIQRTIDEVKAEIGNFVKPSHQLIASCVGQYYEDTCKYPGAEKENKEKQKTESLPDGINNSHPGSGRGDFVSTGQLAVNDAKLVINEEQTNDDNDGANISLNNRRTMQSETLVVITEESQIGDFVTCNKDRKENYCTQKGDSDLFGADKKSLEIRLDGTVPGTKNIYGPVIDMDVSKKSQEEVASTFPSDMCHLFYKANLSCPDHVETLAKEEEISQLQSLLNSHHYSLKHASNWDGESVSDQFDSFLCQCNFNSNSIGDNDETETKGQCCCKTCSAENNTAQSGVGQNSCDGKLHEESQNPASDVQGL